MSTPTATTSRPDQSATRRAGDGLRDGLASWVDQWFEAARQLADMQHQAISQLLDTQHRAATAWTDMLGPLYDVVGEATQATRGALPDRGK